MKPSATGPSAQLGRPGDLVFMPGHVGIYAGNGMVWDAPRTGKAISKRKIWTGSATFGRLR